MPLVCLVCLSCASRVPHIVPDLREKYTIQYNTAPASSTAGLNTAGCHQGESGDTTREAPSDRGPPATSSQTTALLPPPEAPPPRPRGRPRRVNVVDTTAGTTTAAGTTNNSSSSHFDISWDQETAASITLWGGGIPSPLGGSYRHI